LCCRANPKEERQKADEITGQCLHRPQSTRIPGQPGKAIGGSSYAFIPRTAFFLVLPTFF
jgi:hypothetical protein